MPKPFALLEARTAAAAFSRLSNCAAFIDDVAVDAIFANGYAAGQVGALGMASSQPALALPTVQVPANPVGLRVTVDGQAYLIADARNDGTGETHLLLELA
ncbi:MAG: hypothetical protein JZU58_24525 [Curvibacter lanceolatus]|uniref:head-tail joining protein n=1 Tax=Curvibacter lanceolatus TaxID=86182 RepID=UPI002354D8A5|nr:hypothetical protein [Curvibacter lanceolatus]MBV5295514.1 hypothetical protein [Curvibacter lanceolatus]